MTRSIGFIGGGQVGEALITDLQRTGIFTASHRQAAEPVAPLRERGDR